MNDCSDFRNQRSIYVLLIFVVFFLAACSKGKRKLDNQIDQEVVLRIGDFEITKYEFDTYYAKEVGTNTSKKVDKEWLESFINRVFILADAHASHFDTINRINKMVQYGMKTRMARVGEYLWNYSVKPKLTCSRKEIRSARKKMAVRQHFRMIACHDFKMLQKHMNIHDSILTSEEFNDLYDYCINNQVHYATTYNLQWPFEVRLSEVCDVIQSMKPGDISGPLNTSYGILIIQMLGKTSVDAGKIDRKQISKIIIDLKSSLFTIKKNKDIQQKAQTIVNPQVVDALLSAMYEYSNRWINSPSIESLKDTIAMNYNFKGEHIAYTLAQFIDYCSNNPYLMITPERGYIQNMFQSVVVEEYLFDEAKELGITKDPTYLLDRKMLLNDMIINQYELCKFIYDTVVTQDETDNFYKLNLAEFKDFKNARIVLISFDNKDAAMKNQISLSSKLQQNISLDICNSFVPEEKYTCQAVTIDRTKTDIPRGIIDMIFLMPDHSLYPEPVYYNNKYVLIYRETVTGDYTKTIQEVREQIKSDIRWERFERSRKQVLERLRNTYKIECNIIKA